MSSHSAPGSSRNLAKYFVDHPHVAWVLLVAVILGGVLGYVGMPKRKDPEIPVRVAVAAVGWPGARAELVEQAITRKLEAKIAENERVEKIESTSRTGVSIVKIELTADVVDTGREFDDIAARINTIRDWPKGAYPPQFMKDFGSTVALMLTVASPPTPDLEISLRARAIAEHLTKARGNDINNSTDIVFAFPASIEQRRLRPTLEQLSHTLEQQNVWKTRALVQDAGFIAIDGKSEVAAKDLSERVNRAFARLLPPNERHPDLWPAVVVASLSELEPALLRVAGPRYTYKELDDFSEQLQHSLERVKQVSKVTRIGILPEQITLDYSQEKLASAGVSLESVGGALLGQNVNLPGGQLDVGGRNVTLRTSGELSSEHELENVFVTATAAGNPVKIRELFDVGREYQSPQLVNDYGGYDSAGTFRSARAITLAVSMRSGSQVAQFGAAVDAELTRARVLLPPDLVIARVSDQPQQVSEAVALFNNSLYEAIILVVVVALIGFLSWRTAAILALAIPVTLAMTYAVMHLIGWDLQQISISTMILALGLLVDVPVVASDAIVSDIAQGEPNREAAWRGPTRLSVAILFATLTNVVAYLPFLAVPDSIGQFIRSLPVVMTIALLSAWLLSMTFVPVFGAALLRAPKKRQLTLAERREHGFGKVYATVVNWAIRHRALALALAVLVTVASIPAARQLKTAFFPKDLTYLSYVDVWAPEDSTISQTRELAERAQKVVVATTERYQREHAKSGAPSRPLLQSVTTFVGGGGPRFWFSVTPEQQQPNYAQLVIQVRDKHETAPLVPVLQKALDDISGARIDVRQLEMAKPVGIPVAIRISGDDIPTLRRYAERTRQLLNQIPFAERIRDDWGADALSLDLDIDSERAALANVTHQDVASASAASHGGALIGAMRENDTSIPVVARLRPTERADLASVENLYVNAARTGQKVPVAQVAETRLMPVTAKLQRRNHVRTITVACFPNSSHLPSEIMAAVRPELTKLESQLPPGFKLEVGGEEEEQTKGFASLIIVLGISVCCIYVALTLQFKNAVKPVIVFATIPLGVIGALLSLRIAGSPFGFMAFLGIISLIGVIVSHVIVLFDFIEERRVEGASLEDALVDAGIQRLRPVLITVIATVIALVPLAAHGGPLWEPLCYAQIGGLSIATFVTLLIVPVAYAAFVKDLHWLSWSNSPQIEGESSR